MTAVAAFSQGEVVERDEDDTETIGAGCVGEEECEIGPGATKKIKRTTADEAADSAVVVGVRDIDSATWRASAPLVKNKENIVTIELTSLAVSLTAKEKKALGVF